MALRMARKTAFVCCVVCRFWLSLLRPAAGFSWRVYHYRLFFVVELSKIALRPETTMYDCISGESNHSPNPLSWNLTSNVFLAHLSPVFFLWFCKKEKLPPKNGPNLKITVFYELDCYKQVVRFANKKRINHNSIDCPASYTPNIKQALSNN